MTNSLPWFVDGPVRNRWFTELNSMVDLSIVFPLEMLMFHSFPIKNCDISLTKKQMVLIGDILVIYLLDPYW